MKKLAIITASLLIALAASARPITFEDMETMGRVGAPHVSPDGRTIAYDATTIDLAANKSRSAVYLVPATGGPSNEIADGSSPAWSPDGTTLAYVADAEGGTSQVFLYEVAAGISRKLTDLSGGAGTVRWVPNGSGLLVVSDVYPDCGVDPQCTKEKKAAEAATKTSARV